MSTDFFVKSRTSGFFTILLAFWNSLAGLIICVSAFGFFSSAFAPTANECVFVISGPELFNFSYGQAIVFMGVGWLVGAPAAGSVVFIDIEAEMNFN